MAKISLKKGILDVVLYIILFIVIQMIVMYAGAGIWAAVKHVGYMATVQDMATGGNAILLALTSVFSNVITLALFLRIKWTPVTRDYLLSKPWLQLLWVALFTLGAIIPLTFLYEQLGIEMDDSAERLFASLMKEPWGYVAVGILAPLAEEIVFRGAILRTLLDMMSKKNHWVAIMISAAIFGVVHGNMAQFVNALLMGLILGWMYYRTKSLVPGILLHWVNNTVAFILANILPQTNGKLIDLFHGDEKTVYYAVGFSLCIMIPSFIQMVQRLKKG
nr:type II CAAX endopeptidase family protein [uncultured Prevotella sp.]